METNCKIPVHLVRRIDELLDPDQQCKKKRQKVFAEAGSPQQLHMRGASELWVDLPITKKKCILFS